MRFVRGIGALLLLLVGLVGVPMALVALGRNPLPDGFSIDALADALLRPDDGTVLIGLITIAGWLAWLVFALSVVAELITVGSGRPLRLPVPGLAGPRRLVAGLVITVVAMLAVPTTAAQAEPLVQDPTPQDEPAPAGLSEPAKAPAHRNEDGETATEGQPGMLRHTVQRGDELWSLAEKYYGHGRDWRKIAAANPTVLTGGPDRLQPGWVLAIPEAAIPADTDARTITVRAGDTLSGIAENELGDAAEWPKIFRANRAVLSTPDAVDEGMKLIIPDERSARESGKKAGSQQERDRARDSRDTSEESSAAERTRAEEGPSGESTDEPAPSRAPATGGPARPQDGGQAEKDRAAEGAESLSTARSDVVGLLSVGCLLAAGLVGGLAARRRLQLLARPVGRRILHPAPAAQLVETELARRARPLSLRTLDLAIRAISAHCHVNRTALPTLRMARVGDEHIELTMAEDDLDAPVGFAVSGAHWLLGIEDARYLKSVPGLNQAARPYPALVTVGQDETGSLVLVDLEAVGVLPVRSQDAEGASAVLRAMALELSTTPWAQELTLTLTGRSWSLPDALGVHQVTEAPDIDEMLEALEIRTAAQRDHLAAGLRVANLRTDPDLAEPWAPEVVVVDGPMTAAQLGRLEEIVSAEPHPPVAAVINSAHIDIAQANIAQTDIAQTDIAQTDAERADAVMTDPVRGNSAWSLEMSDRDGVGRAMLQPYAIDLTPQMVDRDTDDQVVELLTATGSEETTPAPWWSGPAAHAEGNVTFITQQENGWVREESAIVEEQFMIDSSDQPLHPVLRLLGPVDLIGVTGDPPTRAARQCLEYCAWLLEHPGTTAQQMAAALAVAEGTRRSNMSRLRGWLGSSDDGGAYLPDAYTGSIRLNDCVSSDWDRLKLLTMRGVNRVGLDSLTTALRLVRGAPLADAAPGQWHWAEELRTDMASVIRDIGVEVTRRALDDHDLDLARWAASRSLVAAPEDELLICARIQTEFEAGDQAAVERLSLQLTAHARRVGIDLEEETITLLQRTLEGRPRARMV